mgnify:CR=1 FL=1
MYIPELQYADDRALQATSAPEIQNTLNVFNDANTIHGLKTP